MAPDKWANPQKMWDERFSQPEPFYGRSPNAFLAAQVARLQPGMKVLVPGDGYGRNGIWLAKQGFQVHTVDLSTVAVERARQAAQAAGVSITIEQADLATWHWPVNEFDAVCAIFLHLPPDVRGKVQGSVVKALKPGGLLIFEAFSTNQLKHSSGGPKQVELLYTAATLRDDFAPAEPLQLEETEVQIDEGHMHRGSAAVGAASSASSSLLELLLEGCELFTQSFQFPPQLAHFFFQSTNTLEISRRIARSVGETAACLFR
jgi:SAM-dependent methyltransferase